ncbi:hypothetical protein ACTA71_000135 [Dictyostelium dimigraforme]
MTRIDIKFTINDKSIYQCKSGHFACEQCWKTSLESKKECMICRGIVNSFSDLSRCLAIEQLFGQEECCCIYSFSKEIIGTNEIGVRFIPFEKDEENGCKEIIMAEELESHSKNCKFGFVSCSNEGCKEILRFNSLDQHEAKCTFKLVTCEYCKKDIKMNQLENHHEECPKVTIDCLEGCLEKIRRDQMESHIEDDCNNAIIQCKYSKYGCEFEMKRSELQLHLEHFNHQEFMGELIDELTELNEMVEGLKKEQKILYRLNGVYKNKWIISDYPTYATDRYFSSSEFSVSSHNFKVELYPYTKRKNKDYIHLKLFATNIKASSVNVNYSFTLVNKDISKSKSLQFTTGTEHAILTSLASNSINKEKGWLSDDGSFTIKIFIKLIDQKLKPLTHSICIKYK